MEKAVLDTNFILTCVKQKIDFFEAISFMGFKIIIPEEVVGELKKISFRENKELVRNSKLALKIIGKNNFESVNLKEKNVDKGIIKFAEENPNFAVATLDREIKGKIKNRKIVVKGKNFLGIV